MWTWGTWVKSWCWQWMRLMLHSRNRVNSSWTLCTHGYLHPSRGMMQLLQHPAQIRDQYKLKLEPLYLLIKLWYNHKYVLKPETLQLCSWFEKVFNNFHSIHHQSIANSINICQVWSITTKDTLHSPSSQLIWLQVSMMLFILDWLHIWHDGCSLGEMNVCWIWFGIQHERPNCVQGGQNESAGASASSW